MAFSVVSLAGAQPIDTTSTTQKHPLGTIVSGYDSTYGYGEFIYLVGVVNTVVGTIATYDASSFLTALAPLTANIPAPVAVAMSANVASSYGWYQISGNARGKKIAGTSIVARAAVGLGTTGVLGASATGLQVEGCVVSVTATTTDTHILVTINRPHMMGSVTA
jgi:hypothetical protein